MTIGRSKIDHAQWATYLVAAADDRHEVRAITKLLPLLSNDDAYAIQAAALEIMLGRGDTIAGAKLGLTSAEKQEQMGVDEPVYGWVLASGVVAAGDDGVAEVVVGDLIHPRIEPELVFVLAEDLVGPGVTGDDVLDATASVVGGIEVIDSRYEAFTFTLPDVIADNTSAARLVVGADGVAPRSGDLREISCTFAIDGAETGVATGAALLGDPAGCVAMLANHLGRHGQKLEAGWVIPAGAPCAAQPLAVGTIGVASYSNLESVSVKGI